MVIASRHINCVLPLKDVESLRSHMVYFSLLPLKQMTNLNGMDAVLLHAIKACGGVEL